MSFLRPHFDCTIKPAFQGNAINSDGGSLLHRELDGDCFPACWRMAPTQLCGRQCARCQAGKSRIHLFMQSMQLRSLLCETNSHFVAGM